MLFLNQAIKRQFYKGIRWKSVIILFFFILLLFFFFWGGGGGVNKHGSFNMTALYPNLYYNEVWYKGTVLCNIQLYKPYWMYTFFKIL